MEEKYKHLVLDNYSFDLGSYITKGWDLFKQEAGSFIGFTVIVIIIQLCSGWIIGTINNAILSSFGFTFHLISSQILSQVTQYLSYMLFAGFIVFARGAVRSKSNFNMFFGAFSKSGNMIGFKLLIALVSGLISFTIIIQAFSLDTWLEMMQNPNQFVRNLMSQGNLDLAAMGFASPGFIASWIIGIPLLIYINTSYIFTVPLIVDGNLGIWAAMETSRKVVGKKFFRFLWYQIAVGIICLLALVITCAIGVIVVLPAWFCIQFMMYDSIFKPTEQEDQSEIEAFGISQKDTNLESEDPLM